MKTRNKTLLALASTVVLLSGCGGGGGDSGSSSAPETKTTPVVHIQPIGAPVIRLSYLPEDGGVYSANLLQIDPGHKAQVMMDRPNGLALIYPKNGVEQRWILSMKGTSNTQWAGWMGQKREVGKIPPVVVIRTTDGKDDKRGFDRGRGIVRPAYPVIDLQGNESARLALNLTTTSKLPNGADTPLYPGWAGFVALTPIKSATGELVAGAWQQNDAAGKEFAFVNTANNGGELTVDIALPVANCHLEGKGVASKGLSKLDVTGFGDKCDFKQSSDLNQIENSWMAALAKVGKDQSVTAYVTTYTSAANQEQLVIGFPELDGLLITADKQ
ncbi:hypothetical protein [Aeromonas sp. MdU4]|uniref:hypothetical protein n=1 Tax=Aeromonas sp. MdU4 TaxID=3342819 RepID=UPI0035B993C3